MSLEHCEEFNVERAHINVILAIACISLLCGDSRTHDTSELKFSCRSSSAQRAMGSYSSQALSLWSTQGF